MKVSGLRAVNAVKAAMAGAGLGMREYGYGSEVAGWIEANRFGSTGFSVAPTPDGGIRWHVVLSGEPHLEFEDVWSRDGDQGREPCDPDRLCAKVGRVLADMGMVVRGTRMSSYGGVGDRVGYEVTTDRPEWLEAHDPDNGKAYKGEGPVLGTFRVSDAAYPGCIASRAVLPGYVVLGRTMLTREAIERVGADVTAANAARRKGWTPAYRGDVCRSGSVTLRDGILRWWPSGDGRYPEVPSTRIRNHWGDEVEVWPVPASQLVTDPSLEPDVDVLVDGTRVREIPFATWDAQFGPGAPWSEPEAAPRP